MATTEQARRVLALQDGGLRADTSRVDAPEYSSRARPGETVKLRIVTAVSTALVALLSFASAVGLQKIVANDTSAMWSALIVAAFLAPISFVLGWLSLRNLVRTVELEPDPSIVAKANQLVFEQRLRRALDTAEDEKEVSSTVIRAVESTPEEGPTELLMAGPKGLSVHQVAETGPEGEGPGCPVVSPLDCEAIRRGTTHEFGSSADLDACPHLRDRINGPVSAACVPVQVLGRSVGVIHRIGGVETPPTQGTVAHLEAIAYQAGIRISMLRVDNDEGRYTSLDPLTGILNRQGLESNMRELARNLVPFTVALCDLDFFSEYNDRYGSEMADQAMRITARALQDTLRPNDVLGRYDDDEFLVIFPATTDAEARNALERVRENLALKFAASETPVVTCSIGVAESRFGNSLEDLFSECTLAVDHAKEMGRNRVAIAGEQTRDPFAQE